MDSKTSRTVLPASVEAKMVFTSRIPQDIIDEILDHLAMPTNPDFRSLRSCALVSKSWVQPCQRHLFHTVLFSARDMNRWLKTFPVQEESPANHVRDLRVWIGGYDCVPERFFEYTPWFANVKRVSLTGNGGDLPLRVPSLWRLPQSVTSLIMNTDVFTLVQVRDIVAHLPNLDDLSLPGSFVAVDRDTLPGIGTTLKGRFGGRLQFTGGRVGEDVANMLLEVPTGLHFTDAKIYGTHECFLSTVRLVESCARTLVNLSYTAIPYDGRETFGRSFDFSNFPSLQEVGFGVHWERGGLPWIPTALATLGPATSPHLSVILLQFSRIWSTKTLIKVVGDDLQRVADEVTRIKREFGEAVNIVVYRDSPFMVVLDTLNILQDYGDC